MRRRTPGITVLAALLVTLSNTTFDAQSGGSGMSLILAERVGGQNVRGVATAAGGELWIVGEAGSDAIATTADAVQRTMRGGLDAFLMRIRPDGTVAYATYLGGNSYDYGFGVTVDGSGSVYVVGHTYSTDLPITANAFQPSGSGDDGFLMKLSSDGRVILYSTYLGGADMDEPTAVAVGADGRIHVTGTTYSGATFPLTPGAVRSTGASSEVFYTRFSASGTVEYSTLLGGSSGELSGGLALDAAGNAYVGGYTSSTDFTRQRALKPGYPSGAGAQGFLAKFTPSGLDFSTYVGGSGSDYVYSVAVSSTGVYVGGLACSWDFPGAPNPRSSATGCDGAGYVAKLQLDGSAYIGALLLNGGSFDDRVIAVATDASDNVYAAGYTNSWDFPTTSDAAQVTAAGAQDAFFAKIGASGAALQPLYVTYLGGNQGDYGNAVAADRAGGAWISGWTNSGTVFPAVGAGTNTGLGYVAHYAQTGVRPPESDDIVLYARDAAPIAGNWRLVADSTAAAGVRIENPDAGAAKIGTAAANPQNYFELTFDAAAGVPYHLWLRMKARNDSWMNDSLFVQFSDTQDSWGTPVWRIGSTSAAVVSLEDCTGCGEHGWGWNDNGYNTAGASVVFGTSGRHTIRVQQREDGISLDQIVLSSRTYAHTAPGAGMDDQTILEPVVPPPPDPNEVVVYAAARSASAGAWQAVADATAAGGTRLFNPDTGMAKIGTPAASPASYFEVTFDAQAGVAYHLWLRMKAQNDSWQNDSVFVQFSDSVDGSGNPTWRIGSTAATMVSLEDCSGCGEAGWGWNDNGYNAPGVLVRFATSGTHTLRVQQREDGISIDQIVMSAAKYLNAAPGAPKNDATIVAK